MRKLSKITEYIFYFFLFLLPWQTRLILKEGFLNNGFWEWGTYSLYVIDVVFILLVVLSCFNFLIRPLISNFQFLISKQIQNSKSKIQNSRFYFLDSKFFQLLVICFLLFALLSIFWAKDSNLSFYWWLRLFQGIALFFLIQKIDFSLIKASVSLVLAGFIQFVLAGYQLITQRVFESKWLGMAVQNPSQLGVSVVETINSRFLRVYGSFSHPNIFAGFIVFLLFVSFFLYLQTKKTWQKLSILFFGMFGAAVLFLTYSRAAWFALIIGIIFLCFFIFKKSKIEFRRSFIEFFGVILIIIILFAGLSFENFMTRAQASNRLEQISLNERLVNFERGKEIIQENFLFGVGLGNYTLAFFQKYPHLSSWDYQPLANIYLLILAELGIVGLLLFLLILGFSLKFKACCLCLMSMLVLGLFDHWLFSLSFGIILFWFVLGLLWKKCLKNY